MNKFLTLLVVLNVALLGNLQAQDLDLENIMTGYHWVGHSPNSVRWSVDGTSILFNWNPQDNESDSLYRVGVLDHQPRPVSRQERQYLARQSPELNQSKTKAVYEKYGDLFLIDLSSSVTTQITNTLTASSNPYFSYKEDKVLYIEEQNLFSWNIATGQTSQLTQFSKGEKPSKSKISSSDDWLKKDQSIFQVLSERARKDSLQKKRLERIRPKRPLQIYIGKQSASFIRLSPDDQYVTYRLSKDQDPPNTQVMDYVTESGYAKPLSARPKVGNANAEYSFNIYDIKEDTTFQVDLSGLEGMHDIINLHDGSRTEDRTINRNALVNGPFYSDDGKQAIIEVRALDNKDRWICLLRLSTGEVELLNRQSEVAWIHGPGIGYLFSTPALGWMPDNKTIWYQSEATGYSHLYTLNIHTKKSKALTSGNFEIYNPALSLDKSLWYFTSNETHPGERHFYKMKQAGGKRIQVTSLPGRNDVLLSPDEKNLAILNSTAIQPWELYLMNNEDNAIPIRITDSQTDAFKKYSWRTPEYISFTAQDGEQVPARLYQPQTSKKNGAGIVFVHGAGYLQNAHKWWSSYYREYMFHNLLVDQGYTVIDIDYRGSAGYGRAWRTGIYQFMGGKDLSDQIDGAKYLVEQHQLDPSRLGIYGGSYGGFITLMAMFTEPDVFAAGAALRSVTDWAHYNHPYTSNILNQPKSDSLAFIKSSPIYHAQGLKGSLLMLHGMVDRNVQFQDVVRLSQRLIELKKENWELAVYPMEGHGFREPSSWYDEYRRIYLLFEQHLK